MLTILLQKWANFVHFIPIHPAIGNPIMNQNSTKPTFKSVQKSFSERSVGDDRQKRDKNRPHFNREEQAARQPFKQDKRRTDKTKDKREYAEKSRWHWGRRKSDGEK